jgi:hypothetical protein
MPVFRIVATQRSKSSRDNMPAIERSVTVRYDDGRDEFILNTQFHIEGEYEIEASGSTLTEAFETLAQYIADRGL